MINHPHRSKKTKQAAQEKSLDEIVGYKGFNADWTCQGFRYEIGKIYEHSGT